MTPRAGEVVFRFRYPLHVLLFALGFWAPWNGWLHIDSGAANGHLWGVVAAWLAERGAMPMVAAFRGVLIVAIVLATTAALLRVWGTACLGGGTVQGSVMESGRLAVGGPYRHLRNPLYLGTWIHTLAISILMTPSGALFAVATIGALQFLLIHGEEAFLTRTRGAPYTEYQRTVPRLLPRVRRTADRTPSALKPRWLQAFVAESYMCGVALSFAIVGWRYNSLLLVRCVIVCFGVSLLLRGLTRGERPAADPVATP